MTASGERKAFAYRCPTQVARGTSLTLVNRDTNTVIGVRVADGPAEPRHLLDPTVFSGNDTKFSKYEIPLQSHRFFAQPMPLAQLGELCGIPPGDKTKNNISKCTTIEYAKPFYKGPGGDEIVAKFRSIVLTWV
jgi:hypothetical protein